MENTNNNMEMAMVTTEIMEGTNMVAKLTDQKQVSYCSMNANSPKEKMDLYNAINNAENRLSECANMKINVKDVFCEVVQCVNDSTGECTECPRIVLIDDKGKGYVAVSKGVFSSLCKIFQIFGQPHTWEKPLVIMPKIITKGDKKITTLTVG